MEAAYSLFKAIAYYSMYDEKPDFNNTPIMYAIWNLIEQEIDISIGRRKRNYANDEMDENVQKVMNAIKKNPTASVRAIEKMTGVSKSTVNRIKRGHKKEIEDMLVCEGDSENESDIVCACEDEYTFDSGSENVSGSNSDNDTIGQDRDRTEGQTDEDTTNTLLESLQSDFGHLDSLSCDILSAKHKASIKRDSDKELISLLKVLYEKYNSQRKQRRKNAISKYQIALKSRTKDIVERMKVMAIFERFAEDHKELQVKYLHEKYGAWINGWNEIAQEPNISFGMYGLPYRLVLKQRHNVEGIPEDYYKKSP